jgi:hypothetical protein
MLPYLLTDEHLAQFILPEGKAEKLYFDRDLPGFGIRVRRDAKGRVRRKWFYQYRSRIDGAQQRIGLGNVDRPSQVSATKARQAAARLSENVQTGSDPQRARKTAKKDRTRILIDEATRYLDDRLNGVVGRKPMRATSYKFAKRYFELHWAALSKRPVALISEAEVKEELRGIIKRHGTQAARTAKANLSAFFSWAMREGIAKCNPCVATHVLMPGASRSRTLNDAEIKAIWSACDDDECKVHGSSLCPASDRRRSSSSLL